MPTQDLAKITLQMLNAPDLWPHWGQLPLTRNKPEGGWPDCAVVYEAQPTRVWHRNMFAKPHPDDAFTDYPSREALVEDGWRVN